MVEMDNWFIKVIEQGLEEEEKETKETRRLARGTADKNSIWPTDMNVTCMKKLQMDLQNRKKSDPFPPETLYNFGVAIKAEGYMAEILAHAGVLYETQARVEMEHDGIPITGNIDYIIKDRNNRLTVVEHKYVNVLAYKRLGDTPKKEHMLQIATYILAARNEKVLTPAGETIGQERFNTESGLIVYTTQASKGTPPYRVYEVRMEDVAHDLTSALQTVKEVWRNKDGPDYHRIENASPRKFPCSYCAYRTDCLAS